MGYDNNDQSVLKANTGILECQRRASNRPRESGMRCRVMD